MSVEQDIAQITEREWLDIERELCKRSLHEYVKLAWQILEPMQPFVDGWHIGALCEHLEAVTNGQIRRLLINVPPGTMKSLLACVFWPIWEWGPRGLPAMRYLCASHSQEFATRDNLRARRLVFNSWHQRRWPIALCDDQDTKRKFENQKTGWRSAVAMASATGERGDRVIIDDPHSVEGAISDADRDTTIRVFQETITTRLNNPEKSAIVVIMQRIHHDDVSGFILKELGDYEHLMLPMRYESDRKCKTSIGFEDPRVDDGELLFPERYPEDVVAQQEHDWGGPESPAASGQYQQRPTPRGGLMFEVDKIHLIKPSEVPDDIKQITRYWDKAGTEGAGKRTAGVKMARSKDTTKFYVLNVVKGQWGAVNREGMIKQTAILDTPKTIVWVEQEPGSGGKESAESTVRNLAGYACSAERPTGDKALRAEPFACQVNAGNVYCVQADWTQEYLDELRMFPLAKFKDQVDASSGAFSKVCHGGVTMLFAIAK